MKGIHLHQCSSRSGRVQLPVGRWNSVQFNVVISRGRIEPASGPLPCHRTISEAHAVKTADAAIGGRGSSACPINHSRASVRFHTMANARG